MRKKTRRFDKTYMNLCVEFDQEAFPLEAQFANLGPVKGIYFCDALWEK